MQDKICIFAGTRDGRELAEIIAGAGLDVTACAATEYGGELLCASRSFRVKTGRMDEKAMEDFLREENFGLVIDATHPYAKEVTVNIRSAASNTGTDYLRLIRDGSGIRDNAVFVSDPGEAAAYLDNTEGVILLTTGSKELSAFASLKNFKDRVYARVLPLEESLRLADEAGLPAGRIIAMQGPFSKEMNKAMMRQIDARYMVTKISGVYGGFSEKMEASEECGVIPVVIGRPPEEEGLSFGEILNEIKRRFGINIEAEVRIVGIGMGTALTMTREASDAVREADCLIGAERMLRSQAEYSKPSYNAVNPEKIRDIIAGHPEYRRFCVLMSGDTGFFSGAKKLAPLLGEIGIKAEILPGISSMSYLASRTGEPYDDCKMISLHGREGDISRFVNQNRKVICLVGGEDGTSALIDRLVSAGLGDVVLHVGERLGYEDEKITSGSASELAENSFDSLSTVMIINERAALRPGFGFPDGDFIRGGDSEGTVPMTKSEVRAVALSKLRLCEDSVCWDIGAGTGSVSIEMALNAPSGTVYAIEKKEKAIELLRENISKFGVYNLKVVEGSAPEALHGLPAPTHVFIGGSSGNMREIIELVLSKNKNARIIAQAVSLETVGELTALVREYGFYERETVCLNVARAREAGRYSLMTGQNPIYVFTMQNTAAADTQEGSVC